MRRPILLTFIALGAITLGLGGTGLFAALSDTARTGTNSVSSKALAGSADLQLSGAHFDPAIGGIACEEFSENLSTGLVTFSDMEAGGSGAGSRFCIRNVGSATVTLTALVEDMVDLDTACTGDEAAAGDATCGDNQAGELSQALWLDYFTVDCATSSGTNVVYGNPAPTMATTLGPVHLGTIAGGATRCFSVSVQIPGNRAQDAVQKAQSDVVTWRYAFTGQA